MTDQSAQEPTMEEILASIRRIISEDDAPAETAPTDAPEPTPAPMAADTVFSGAPVETPAAPAPQAVAIDDDVLELTDLYQAPADDGLDDLDVVEAPTPEAAPSAAPYDSLVGESAAASAASAFAGLAASFKKPESSAQGGRNLDFDSGNTVEDMVRAMLRPMLSDWLDANLPGIVQAAVQKEVERIARSA